MLTLGRTHDTTITIDNEKVLLHIKRLGKAEAIAFERDFKRYGQPKGSAERTPEEQTKFEEEVRAYLEHTISAFVSVEPGCISDSGKDVISGDDFLATFCARNDVLLAAYQSVYATNFLGAAQKKILSSQPGFYPGSEQSIPKASGEKPGPTAGSAASSSSASGEAATASSDSPDTASDETSANTESSGPKVH